MSFFNLFGGKTTEIAKESETKNIDKIENVEETNKNDKISSNYDELSVRTNLLEIENKKLKHELDTLRSSTNKLIKKYHEKKQLKYLINRSDKLLRFDDFDFKHLINHKTFICWDVLFYFKKVNLYHIISHGRNMDALDIFKKPFLYYLAKHTKFVTENPDIINIIDGKFDLEIKDGKNIRPITHACMNKNMILMKYLVDKGVELDDKIIDFIEKNVESNQNK